MKNLMLLVIGLATALSMARSATAQTSFDLETIDKIGLSINAIVTISEGNNQQIRVDGPDYLVDDINTDVKNGSWNIEYEDRKNQKTSEQLEIEIQVKSLKSIAVSGIGEIKSQGRFSKVERRNIAVSGTGTVIFTGDADQVDIALSGVGHIEVDSDSEYMHVALSGTGDIKLNGSTDYLNMAASGSGTMGGTGLSTKRCKAAISGSTVLTAAVSDHLDLIVSGSGVFRYSGNPKINKKGADKSALEKF